MNKIRGAHLVLLAPLMAGMAISTNSISARNGSQHTPPAGNAAPAVAGFPSFTEQQGERILEKGTGPEGEEIRPPMHIYHMNHADAKAIIVYLKSLPRNQSPN